MVVRGATGAFIGVLLVLASVVPGAWAYEKRPERTGDTPIAIFSADCVLSTYDTCAGWIWVFDDVEGAVWGSVLDPTDCLGGCLNGGRVSEIWIYSHCVTTPATLGGVGLWKVDALGCRTTLLHQSPPIEIVHCVSGDRWTEVHAHEWPGWPFYLQGEPFAITLTWGPAVSGRSNPEFASDNALADLYCARGVQGFPGCAGSSGECGGWTPPPVSSYIYVSDLDGDGVLEDLCALYGVPYPLAFPYLAPYGYLANRLILSVGLDCSDPIGTERTRWGRVKSLFE